MSGPKPDRWFFRRVLSERQTMAFLIASAIAVALQSCAVNSPEPDYHFIDKGSFVTYLELFGCRIKLVAFREGFFWYWVGLHSLAILVAVKLKSRIALLLTIVLPMLWIFAIVGVTTPGQG